MDAEQRERQPPSLIRRDDPISNGISLVIIGFSVVWSLIALIQMLPLFVIAAPLVLWMWAKRRSEQNGETDDAPAAGEEEGEQESRG